MRTPLFRGTVTHGRIVLDNRDRFREHLAAHEGKRIELTLREKQETVTDPQRRFYQGVVIKMISEKTGDTPADTHENMKKMFNNGETTTKLKTKEFNEYMGQVMQWSAEFLDHPIPDPGQVDY